MKYVYENHTSRAKLATWWVLCKYLLWFYHGQQSPWLYCCLNVQIIIYLQQMWSHFLMTTYLKCTEKSMEISNSKDTELFPKVNERVSDYPESRSLTSVFSVHRWNP
jgi:hypothetical protein